MREITHIEALREFASALYDNTPDAKKSTESPVDALSKYIGLHVQTHSFARVLSWLIAFHEDALRSLAKADIAERVRGTATANAKAIFAPFIPPFGKTTVGVWYGAALSTNNQSYFDLLNDVLLPQSPIFVPERADIEKYSSELTAILEEMRSVELPPWIERDFRETIELTLIVIEKVPYVAHRFLQDAHATLLGRLFSKASPSQRKFMVRVATTINVVLAAFVMPHEAASAGRSYYGWIAESPPDLEQIKACAKPLALPPPFKK